MKVGVHHVSGVRKGRHLYMHRKSSLRSRRRPKRTGLWGQVNKGLPSVLGQAQWSDLVPPPDTSKATNLVGGRVRTENVFF